MTAVRKSTVFLAWLATLLLLLGGMFLHASRGRRASAPSLERTAALVRQLGLTDLCLFPEANYTRHLSQADVHTPFQDGPLSLEKFPAGSLAPPPFGITWRNRADVD